LLLFKTSRSLNLIGFALFQLVDGLWAGLTDLHVKTPMGVTAENLAEKYGITREDNDNYALKTQQRWGQGGAFTEQLSCCCLFYFWPQLIQVHAGLAMLPIFSGY